MVSAPKFALISLALSLPVLGSTVLAAQVPLAGPGTHAALAADIPFANNATVRDQVAQLFALANQERTARGLSPLAWDPALGAAALNHCTMMADQGQISHQYAGEPDLAQRASQTGAHFKLVEENVAEGYSPASVHQAWMNSQGHRENLLNPRVDHIGIAVVSRGSALYAVADFSQAVPLLTQQQVEAAVSSLVRATGLAAHASSTGARIACAQDHGLPVSLDNRRPEFIMRWEDADLDRLPEALLERIATGRYRDAAVGSCPVDDGNPTFTAYRVAVLLLRPEAATLPTYISSTK